MKIVLYQPEIPSNTGNVIRTCFLTGVGLALVQPFGFSLEDKKMRRAGLDYYKDINIEQINFLDDYLHNQTAPFYFFSSKAKKLYTDVNYSEDSLLIFGSETSGLPDRYFKTWPDNFVTIPMKPLSRCLNLSNTVSIAIYEALRQQNFKFTSL